MISIHAPAKGATVWYLVHMAIWSFQSTLPRRERHRELVDTFNVDDFNPRSREGSDPAATGGRYTGVFQSTLPRRERHFSKCRFEKTSQHFNPRSREGSDIKVEMVNHNNISFQSTLPRRERRICCVTACSTFRFQSTLPRRERP